MASHFCRINLKNTVVQNYSTYIILKRPHAYNWTPLNKKLIKETVNRKSERRILSLPATATWAHMHRARGAILRLPQYLRSCCISLLRQCCCAAEWFGCGTRHTPQPAATPPYSIHVSTNTALLSFLGQTLLLSENVFSELLTPNFDQQCVTRDGFILRTVLLLHHRGRPIQIITIH